MNIQRSLNDLEIFFTYNSWELKVENQKIKRASLVHKIYYWILSFFSKRHSKELDLAIQKILRNVKEFKAKTEKERIIFKKIKRLKANLESTLKNEKSWTYLTIKTRNPLLQPYRDGKFFYNNLEYKKNYWKVLFRNFYLLFSGIFKRPWRVDLNRFVKRLEPKAKSEDLKVQWLGHSSFFIQVNDQNILIDPVFSNFVSPCFKRYTPVGIDLKDLPKIDTILISHNHVDHLDEKTLKNFVKYQPAVLVPLGLKRFIQNLGFKNVIELNWFDEVFSKRKENQLNFISTPAYHWSQPIYKFKQRVMGNETLWCGWVIKANDKTLYHSGDTAKVKRVFNSINRKFNTLDCALLPIAPENEEDMHMGVDSFFKATKIIKAKKIIPMHYLTFRMGPERIEDPYFALEKKLKEEKNSNIQILKIGEIFQETKKSFVMAC